VILCLQLARQADDPHLTHAGPAGWKALQHLQSVMAPLEKKNKAPDNYLAAKSRPRFEMPRQTSKTVKGDVARRWVQKALQRAAKSQSKRSLQVGYAESEKLSEGEMP
jgi:hypothetical protein